MANTKITGDCFNIRGNELISRGMFAKLCYFLNMQLSSFEVTIIIVVLDNPDSTLGFKDGYFIFERLITYKRRLKDIPFEASERLVSDVFKMSLSYAGHN